MGRRKKRKRKPGWIEVADGSPKPKGVSVVPLRQSSSSPKTDQIPACSDSVAVRIRDIRLAIERRSSKSALEKAKQFHKEVANDESKSILIDAYLARVEAMLAKDLTAEARALADLVVSRFPESAGRLAHLRRDLAARTGDVTALVAPLADPNVTPEKRGQTEQAIRSGLIDVQALAACPALPQDHPLRTAAAAVARAFTAVTTGEVDDMVVALPEVSRRSPLAGWKSLIRAIASLYRGQDEDCRRFLAAIDNDCAPARAADSVRSILTESLDGPTTQAGRSLVQKVAGPRVELRAALRALDEAFSRGRGRELYRQMRQTVLVCERACPQILERLKQHISVKASVADCPVEAVVDALGGRSLHDAYFWRLFARAIEGAGDSLGACVLWDYFRSAAIEEGLFAADGQENAFLYLHMAELLRRVPPDHLQQRQTDYRRDPGDLEDFYDEDESQPPWMSAARSGKKPDLYFLFPERLYDRACALLSDPNIYRDWLDYVQMADRRDLKPDAVALKWAAAFPQDGRPLIHLAESAEQRNAFNKALKYIEQAERLGGIDPKVRRARFRLLVAKAVRHLEQRNLNLVEKDLVQIDELPHASEKDRPAFIASLRWLHAMLDGNHVEADRLNNQIRDLLGGQVAAAILLLSTTNECQYSCPVTKTLETCLSAYKEKDILGAITRTCPIGTDVNIEILLPAKWASLLKKWLKRSDCELDNTSLLTVAEAALTSDWSEVAYYCCGYGLQSGGPEQARFMFLRGRSLPYFSDVRRQECFAAALALAKRVRDMDLVAEIMEISRQGLGSWGWSSPFGADLADMNDLRMDDEALERITKFERRTRKYPKNSRMPVFGARQSRAATGQCQCPACRHARGETNRYGEPPGQRSRRKASPAPKERYLFEDIFDDDLGEEFSEAELLQQAREVMPEFANIPTELLDIAAAMARLNGGKLPKGRKEIDRIASRHPEMQSKIAQLLLQLIVEEGMDPFGDVDFDGPGKFGGELPSRPWEPRRRKKRRRRR
ncbi:MAG: hypothetical protein ISS70_06620 [Phycisphaerae bacterium]|nr:hypothetical protein [Phycisphaerae bacterium]